MIDLDNSFLRLRDNFDDAKNLNESRQVDKQLAQYTQIHLCPNESYFQITNSPTSISFNDNYEVFAVDECGNELEDVTTRIFIEEFIDSNAIKQMSWEFINSLEYYAKPISLRFRNTVNNDMWWTNLFVSSEYNSEYTTRMVYKNFQDHYGTQYSRQNYYQSIRLSIWKDFEDEDIEVGSYTQITDGNRYSLRPTITDVESYIAKNFNHWTKKRLSKALLSNEKYFNDYSVSYTELMERKGREMDSNFFESELLVNVNYNKTFTYENQLFSGLVLSDYNPFGLYITGYQIEGLSVDANIPIELNTGTLSVYDSSDALVHTFTESDMVINSEYQLKIISTGTPVEFLSNDTYYVNMTANLISGFGIPNPAITNNTTWTFTLQEGQYNSEQYTNSQYFTN